jgi:plasmid maintenance system killer protein
MKIIYKKKKMEGQAKDFRKAVQEYGDECAKLFHQRLKELEAIDSIEMMTSCKIGGCHLLKGKFKGKYGLDLKQPYRLIVEPIDVDECVNIVRIIEVVNYHD